MQGRGRHEMPDLPPHLASALRQVGREIVDEHTHEQDGQHGDADVHAHHGPHLWCDVTRTIWQHGPFLGDGYLLPIHVQMPFHDCSDVHTYLSLGLVLGLGLS